MSTIPATVAQPSLGRSLAAIAGGFFAAAIVTTLVDGVLHATGVFPPLDAPPMSRGLFALAFAYRVGFDIGGGWLTARLAPNRPMLHAKVVGGIGLVLSTAGAVAMWHAGPAWYSLGNIAIALPCPWFGGWWFVRRRR